MFLLFVLAAALAGVALHRGYAARRAERVSAARLPRGANGIILGAEPIDMAGSASRAVLLLHGFGDTPQSLRYLAEFLVERRWAVHAPLMPGHGRNLRAFGASRHDEWIDAAKASLALLTARYPTIAIVGQSMGGALAVTAASESPAVRCVVLLAPYLTMPARIHRVARSYVAWSAINVYLRGRGERSIRDPNELTKSLAYGFTTPRLLHELEEVTRHARLAAPALTVPTLMIQSRDDNRIPSDAAAAGFALIGAEAKELVWTSGNGHVLSVDRGREAIFERVGAWLERYAAT